MTCPFPQGHPIGIGELQLGDVVRYNNRSPHTKPEYWNPVFRIIYDAPSFRLKHIGGGTPGDSLDFVLKHCSEDLEVIEWPEPSEFNIFDLIKSFHQPEGEGWAVFNLRPNPTRLEDLLTVGIERDDEEAVFEDDSAAQDYVLTKAEAGSDMHRRAALIHARCDQIRELIWGPEWVNSRCGPPA